MIFFMIFNSFRALNFKSFYSVTPCKFRETEWLRTAFKNSSVKKVMPLPEIHNNITYPFLCFFMCRIELFSSKAAIANINPLKDHKIQIKDYLQA
jgi:hypothetical protein